jgi:hypothetical protein
MISKFLLLFSILFSIYFSAVAQQQDKAKPVLNPEKNLQLSAEEWSKKDAIHAYSKVLTEDDRKIGIPINYFAFTQYDKSIAIRLILYIMADKTVTKFCPTKAAFALVTTTNFSSEKLIAYATTLGLTLHTITEEEYLKTVK